MRLRGSQIGVTIKTAGGLMDHAFDLVGLARHVDYLNVLGYDYHGHWDDRTGINAALESNDPEDKDNVVSFTVEIRRNLAPKQPSNQMFG